MGGSEVPLARWRESFGWWAGEPYRETARYLDGQGRWRQKEREIGRFVTGINEQKELETDNRDDWTVQRERKIRDEKARAALGGLPVSYYERAAQERASARAEVERKASVTMREHVPEYRPDNRPMPLLPEGIQEERRFYRGSELPYVPLHVHSGYAFGRSTILAEEIPAYCGQGGMPAVAIADPYSLVGCVEFSRACKRWGVKPLIGASIGLPEGGEVVLIARNKVGYRSLSRLISECHLGEARLFPLGNWERLARHSEGLLCLTGGNRGPLDRLLAARKLGEASELVRRLVGIYGLGGVFVEIERSYLPWMMQVNRLALELAESEGLTAVAGGAMTHARREHFPAQDVLVCAHTLATVEEAIGRKPARAEGQPACGETPLRSLNAEGFLRTSREMGDLYRDRPELLANTLRVAELCEDVLPERTELPPLFGDDVAALRAIVETNAPLVYTQYGPAQKKRLAHELERIIRLGFATHFLVAGEMCRWASEQGIHLSGRGSAVDSAVAYVLGFSRIDAMRHNLHFDRFLPADGSKRPDIDIDFEARRRDDVRGYLIRRFGVERTATVAAIGSYRVRGIVRQVGKVMGLPDEVVGFLAKRIHGGVSADQLASALEKRPELRDSPIPKEKLGWIIHLADRLMDVPFDIGCHSSGLCISATPIRDVVPVMPSATPNSTESGSDEPFLRIMQWDKRSSKYYFDKFDILCLRGQDVLSGTERRVRVNQAEFSSTKIDIEDPEVYRAMRSGELIGIPQSASPAMRQAHIRLRTNDLHDCSLVQAGIRPGVGGAVKINELIARRRGKPFTYEHPDFEPILGLTYGIIVFQEQVDQLLQQFCGFSSGQAEEIRDGIHKRRREDYGELIQSALIEAVLRNGYGVNVANQVFELVSGFKGYGFAQGHALAFAEISLRCVHLMQNEPSAYFAALLSAQPAGYYGPCTIANEARLRGAAILPPDVNRSEQEFSIEDAFVGGLRVPGGAIRTGLMQISEVSQKVKDRILSFPRYSGAMKRDALPLPTAPSKRVATLERPEPEPEGPFTSFFDFVTQVRPSRDELEALILCGSLDRFCPNRRAMLWAIPSALDYAKAFDDVVPTLPLRMAEPPIDLRVPDFDLEERAALERGLLGMDIERHLMSFEREAIQERAMTTLEVKALGPGQRAVVVGNAIRLRFPPTSSGKRVVFFDLEDETGLLNVTAFDDVYQRDGKAIVTAPYVTLIGETQDRDGHTAFLLRRAFEYRPQLLRGRARGIPIRGADFLVG
jgi:error-prone DNA polymerase